MEGFLRNESTVTAKEKRKQAKKNRSKIRGTHNSGRFGYAGKKKWPTRTKSISRTDAWVEAHAKKDGIVPEDIGSIMNKDMDSSAVVEMPRAICIPYPAQGHINPIASVVAERHWRVKLLGNLNDSQLMQGKELGNTEGPSDLSIVKVDEGSSDLKMAEVPVSSSSSIVRVPPEKRTLYKFGQRTSNFHGVTRHRWTGKYEAHLWDNSTITEGH